jgi:uncharacterized membrane protein YfcA
MRCMSPTLLLAGATLALGGFVQGVIGFGIALVGVPIVALIEPSLLPGPMLLLATVLTLLALAREHEHVDWRGVGWAMLGRLPGTAIGVLVVDALPQKQFLVVVGLGVLAFTLLSVISWHPRPTAPALTTAGLLSGALGTAMAIGGPPVALLYQNERGARIRSTLSAYFLLGSFVSAVSLALAGHFSGHDALSALELVPFLLTGFALSGPVRKHVDAGGRIRYLVLAFAGASALVLIGRSLFV